MDLMYNLNSGMQLDFMKPQPTRENRNPQPGWWSIKSLPDWADTKAAGQAYQNNFEEAYVDWDKYCHMHRCETEYASSRNSLNPDVIATMTKHKLPGMGDIQTTYMTELSPKVLACMSHTDKDDYFVART